ncbi:hypothetical protein J6590_101071 [Homalodisca vitripennis]|nr:hypothetical protein J6590_101071 [Homalodisca vitripennis]
MSEECGGGRQGRRDGHALLIKRISTKETIRSCLLSDQANEALSNNLRTIGLKVASEPLPTSVQPSCLQGQDRSAVTHPSSNDARPISMLVLLGTMASTSAYALSGDPVVRVFVIWCRGCKMYAKVGIQSAITLSIFHSVRDLHYARVQAARIYMLSIETACYRGCLASMVSE